MDSLPEDHVIIRALRAGDEAMFATLLDAWSRGMLLLARSYLSTGDSAQEVVQDTWLAVLGAIDGFQGRSSLKTWVYRILINTAKKRSLRESRTLPWSSAFEEDGADIAVLRDGEGQSPAHWLESPASWPTPEGEALAGEARGRIAAALAELSPRQRTVITLRDVEGYTSEEVCEILEITAANQRVLLHRARTAVRGRLEEYFKAVAKETEEPSS